MKSKILKFTLDSFKKIIPWAVAFLILMLLFLKYPPEQIWDQLQHTDIPLFTGFSLAYYLIILFTDSWLMQKVIHFFDADSRFSFKHILIARMVSYPLMTFNYFAGQVAFAYSLHQQENVSFKRMTSVFLYVTVLDLLWFCLFAFVGSLSMPILVGKFPINAYLNIVTLSILGSLFLAMIFKNTIKTVLPKNKKINAIFEKVKIKDWFFAFDKAHFRHTVWFLILKTPIHFVTVVSLYFAIIAFGATIPLEPVLFKAPVIFLAAGLPISPGGLGTVNFAMVELLAPEIKMSLSHFTLTDKKELMFGVSLLWIFANYFLKITNGMTLMFWRSIKKKKQ